MAKKSKEQKVAELVIDSITHNEFNISLCANHLVNLQSLYSQQRLIDLFETVLEYQANRYDYESNRGNEAHGLATAKFHWNTLDKRYSRAVELDL